ncbi:MAG TPA: carbohydrate ABC transporter permease [Hadesarchaea archaeon]|nr:carbohydrate ABC transporter permease [Hadesarchaea archaeon]
MRISFNWRRFSLYAAIIILCLIWILPLLTVAFASFKTEAEIKTTSPLSPPSSLFTGNYLESLTEGSPPIGTAFKNTLIITVPAVAGSIFLGALAAYPLSRLRFRGSVYIYMLLIFGMMFPYQLVMVPLYQTASALGLYQSIVGNYTAVILAHIVFGVPFCAFILRNFFRGIPRSLQDAAMIDGCSHFSFFWKVLLPLALPALAVLALLQFTGIYNDMLWALVLMPRVETYPIATTLASLSTTSGTSYGILTAAGFLAVIPTLLLFVFLQKYFLKGLAAVGQ